jgi:hypothetical protein
MPIIIDGSFIPAAGRNLLNYLIGADLPLTIERAAVGNGALPADPDAMTALVAEVMDGSFSQYANPGTGEARFTVQVSSIGVAVGFNVTEVGIYAMDPRTETETLLAYVPLHDHPQWIRPASAAINNVATFDVIVAVGAVDEIAITLDPSSLVSRQDFEELEGRVEVLEGEEKVKRYGVRWAKSSSSPIGERIHDAAGLVAAAGVGATPVINDFDNIYPWAGRRRCNGYYNEDGSFTVTAYKGDGNYAEDGSNGEVWVETPLFYYRDASDANYEYMEVSMYPIPDFLPAPHHINKDGSLRQYAYTAAYKIATVGGLPTSRSGVFSDHNSLNGFMALCDSLGEGYVVETAAERFEDNILFYVEFATKDGQSIMMGAANMPYAADHTALVAEAATNRIIITDAQAALYRVGQTICIGTGLGEMSKAANRIVTSISSYAAGQSAIYFDGAPVAVAVGNVVWSSGWKNGSTDMVVASSGSPVSNSEGRYPCIYRGKEDPWGNVWTWLSDLLFTRDGADPAYVYKVYFLPDASKYNAGAVTADYVELDVDIPTANGYIKAYNADKRYPWIKIPKDTTGASNTYFCDHFWLPAYAVTAALVGGDLGSGVIAGPAALTSASAPSPVSWNVRARLSHVTG